MSEIDHPIGIRSNFFRLFIIKSTNIIAVFLIYDLCHICPFVSFPEGRDVLFFKSKEFKGTKTTVKEN